MLVSDSVRDKVTYVHFAHSSGSRHSAYITFTIAHLVTTSRCKLETIQRMTFQMSRWSKQEGVKVKMFQEDPTILGLWSL